MPGGSTSQALSARRELARASRSPGPGRSLCTSSSPPPWRPGSPTGPTGLRRARSQHQTPGWHRWPRRPARQLCSPTTRLRGFSAAPRPEGCANGRAHWAGDGPPAVRPRAAPRTPYLTPSYPSPCPDAHQYPWYPRLPPAASGGSHCATSGAALPPPTAPLQDPHPWTPPLPSVPDLPATPPPSPPLVLSWPLWSGPFSLHGNTKPHPMPPEPTASPYQPWCTRPQYLPVLWLPADTLPTVAVIRVPQPPDPLKPGPPVSQVTLAHPGSQSPR